jgi:propionyl-CoA synthetase
LTHPKYFGPKRQNNFLGLTFPQKILSDDENGIKKWFADGEMEKILAAHDALAECSVIGVYDSLKRQIPVGLTVLKDGVNISQTDLQFELVTMVRQKIGAVACLTQILIVERLPKTRSRKIRRKSLRHIAEN